ncbi:MAG TPA: hypothetical protein VG435_02080 [Acidimicrobiales bacterium]|jgi:hypothetical protein|nr:hypothetical protein [Acidimicrobiales bacterium]
MGHDEEVPAQSPPSWPIDALGPWGPPDAAVRGRPGPPPRRVIAMAIVITGLLVAGGVGVGVHAHRHYAAAPPVAVTAPASPSVPSTIPGSFGYVPGTCSSGPPGPADVNLPQTLFSDAPYFTPADAGPQGRLGETQLEQLGGLADTPDGLTGADFVAAQRQVFHDVSAGTDVEVRVYQFGCSEAALGYFQGLQSYDLGIVSPVAVPGTGNGQQAEGWASGGPDSTGEFRQAAVGVTSSYYAAVYTFTAQPVDAAFTMELLTAELAYLNDWTADSAALPPPPNPAPAPTLIARRDGQAPICPAATGTVTANQFNTLLPDALPGYEQLPATAPAGPITAASVSQLAPVPALGAVVTAAEGFSGGYRRYWEAPSTHDEVEVQLIVFSCDTAARLSSGSEAGPGQGWRTFPVTDGIAQAAGAVATTKNSKGHYEAVLSAPVGKVDLTVAYFSPSTDTSTLESLALTVEQHVKTEVAAGAATPP